MMYKWQTVEAFDAWHETVKEALGIPYPNVNSKTGEIDENATWTTAYTNLREDDNGVKFAKVEEEIAAQYSEGLGEPHEPYYNMEDFI